MQMQVWERAVPLLRVEEVALLRIVLPCPPYLDVMITRILIILQL